ncbi:MAG: sigma factor-like helix-turn-helix DNA-binding protein [Candidatus Gracilibacteria bacterium]
MGPKVRELEREDFLCVRRLACEALGISSGSIEDKSHQVAISRKMQEIYSAYYEAESAKDNSMHTRHPATIEECNAMTLAKIFRIAGSDDTLSLQDPIAGEDDGETFDALVSYPEEDGPFVPADTGISGQTNDRLLSRLFYRSGLTAIERYVINRRFGLGYYDTRGRNEDETLKTVGDGLELSRERIRQLQNRAFKKMRNILGRIRSANS